MSPMLVVLPYCPKDVELAEKLLNWIVELGDNKPFSILLAADSKVPKDKREELKMLAMETFSHAATIPCPVDGEYPAAANKMFAQASNWVLLKYKTPFLWLEPDAVPLKSGWLHDLATAYYWSPKPFMGPFVRSDDPRFPAAHLNGVSIYPNNAWDILNSCLAFQGDKAWDIASAEKTVSMATDTKLIYQFFGQQDLPPSFVDSKTKDSEEGVVTTKIIQSDAVLFHRSKDGSLIDLARKRIADGKPVVEPGNIGFYEHVRQKKMLAEKESKRAVKT